MGQSETTGDRGVGNKLGVVESLRGVQFPASRAELAEQARKNGADEASRYAIEHLPDRVYASSGEVADAVGGEVPPAAGQGSAPHGGEPQADQARPAPVGDATKGVDTIPGSEG